MSKLIRHTIVELQSRLARREVSAKDAVTACLSQIEATNHSLNAFVSVQADQALETARLLDRFGPDPSRPLWGVPMAVKDILTTKGTATTCASKILDGFVPFYDAHCVARLRESGAIILGKLNMDEFAMGSSTERSIFGPTKNPWDHSRVSGGSSGGSAVAVAAGQCFGSLGTDTGGSIRQPASFCGVVGMKPTYGRISRYGLIAYSSSLDQVGPITRTIADNAAILAAIAGHDPHDSTCSDKPVPNFIAAATSRQNLKGIRLGLPKELWGTGLNSDVEAVLHAAIAKAEGLGAELVEVNLPNTQYAVATYYIMAMAEASSNLARFDGVRYGLRDMKANSLMDLYVHSRSCGFGDEVRRRIIIGTYVLSAGHYEAYYRKAAQVRRIILEDYLQALERCDVICSAASPVPAWQLGTFLTNPLQMYLMDIFTVSLNLSGLPGLCMPAGLTADTNLPVGLQLFGRAFDEVGLYAVAGVLEMAFDAPNCPINC
ncbi:Glutamyl-tRNA(Gln) amidotransferase subunit A [Desulfovibrionales bacterium]